MSDYAIDLHSGGSSLHYVPTVLYGDREDEREMAEVLRMTRVCRALCAALQTIWRQCVDRGRQTTEDHLSYRRDGGFWHRHALCT